MDKEEILKLIKQQIKIALKEFKQELEQGMRVEKPPISKEQETMDFISLQQFINEKRPRKVASEEMPVMAYYLREIDKRKLNEMNEEAVKASYKKTDRVRPKKIKQAFIDNSFFDKVSNKSGFYKLNDDGEYFVEVTLKERKNKRH